MGAAGPDREARLAAWLDLLEARHTSTIDLGLERCGAVYERLGTPRPARQVITVAGTNGKGSTVAWCGALLSALDLRHGAYTSPHLLRFNERLRLQGEDVGTGELLAAFDAVEAARGDVSLSFFEFTTLACFWIMARHSLDVAVLEVGLGGRLDTVNLVDADVAVITPIGLDHQAYLGNDREAIGREKAGILRAGRPVVCGEPEPPASVLEAARRLGCPMALPGRDYDVTATADGVLNFTREPWRFRLPDPVAQGVHQRVNLAAALAGVLDLGVAGHAGEAAFSGIGELCVAGRLQALGPPPGVLVDVGHNPLAARTIAAVLSEQAPRICVLAMLADKDAEGVATALAPVVDAFYCAGITAQGRDQSGAVLGARLRKAVDRPVQVFDTVPEALESAGHEASGAAGVLVFGSFHTVKEALEWLEAPGRATAS